MKKKKSKRIVFAELIVIVAIISAILFPNIIGFTEIASFDSKKIGSIKDLKDSRFVCEENDGFYDIIKDKFPNANIEFASGEDTPAKLVSENKADAFLATRDSIDKYLDAYDNLCVLPMSLNRVEDKTRGINPIDGIYIIVNKSKYKYATTRKDKKTMEKEGITYATFTGSVYDQYILEFNPKAKILFFDTFADILSSVSTGKADFSTGFDTSYEDMLLEYDNLASLYEATTVVRDCFVTAKNEKGKKLGIEFNEYLKSIRENGKYDNFLSKWTVGDPGEKDTEEYNFNGKNGEINVCTCGDWTPMSYFAGDRLVGFFVEMIKDFSEKYGYKPNFHVCNYKSEMAGISSGLYDFLADVVEETEERKEEVNLTDVVFEQTILTFTKGEQNNRTRVSKLSKFISDLKGSFDKTFIKEGRWKLLLRGLKTTLLISIFSGLFGTILGAIVCAFRMSSYSILTALGRIYIKVIQGTPIVVMLLFLYYLVFASSNIDAFYVCVIGFSIDFAAYASEIFRSGIESVPKGQYKAAIALGFGKIGAFLNVVMPQSLVYILPVFVGQFVSMVKITSVAGYISVEDLTKASDLIRSRTYEAFFPIVLTAIIYFIISNLLTLILKQLTEMLIPYSKINNQKEVK